MTFLLLTLLLGPGGCDTRPTPAPPITAALLHRHVPANPHMVWQLRNLRDSLDLLDHFSSLWPLPDTSPCEVWRRELSQDACQKSFWQGSVLATDAPVLLFLHQGQWHMLGGRHPDFEERQEAWQLRHPSGSAGAATPVTKHVVHLALGPKAGPPTGAGSWPASPKSRQVIRDAFLGDAPLAGLVDVPMLLEQLPATNPGAQRLKAAMAQEVGTLALKAHASGRTVASDWTLYARAQGSRLEEAGPANRARAPFRSELGALIQPGILGVMRISTNPRLLFQWWRATLSAAQRLAMDEVLGRLKKEVALGIDEAIFDNLQGHAVAVFYGLESKALGLGPQALLGSLMALEATQEVIYMPIEHKQPLEELLNAATQLSRGRLQQQRDKTAIQYAWFEDDGTLTWALMLHEDYLLFVDSPATFSHGTRHIRHPRPLEKAWAAGGLTELLLPSPSRSGIHLDTQTLHQLLPQAGPKTLGQIESVTLLSDESSSLASLYELARWSITVRLKKGRDAGGVRGAKPEPGRNRSSEPAPLPP